VIEPGDERARPQSGPRFTDAVTFAWGDPATELYGLARAGLAAPNEATALAVLFAGRAPAGAIARGGIEIAPGSDFAALELPGLVTTVGTPLRSWTVAFDGGETGFELTFEALGVPAEIDPAEPFARVGAMRGYEQLCLVRGTARAGGREHPVACFGQRSHTWGDPDWERLEATRTLAAWLDDGTGVSVLTVRPAGAQAHAGEVGWGALLDPAGNVHVDEPRLSTTYDAGGRQRRAGLELWVGGDDGFARRAAGEVVCGSTFELGTLRLDAAVFRWHSEGRSGIGRYDILHRAPR
jgi:hypothetical protein